MIQQDELAKFCELLQALLCGDNEKRKESERLYQATLQCDPDRLCKCLVTVLTQAPDDTLRQQSAVLLRHGLKSSRPDFIWSRIPAETQAAIKAQLILSLRAEPVRVTRHKVCDAVSMLACYVLDATTGGAGFWSEIGPVLSELVEADDSNHRESAVRIIKDMLALNVSVVQSLVGGKIAVVLQRCQGDASPNVRKESVLLYAALLENLTGAETQALKAFVPQVLAVTQQLENDEAALQECLQALVQVVESSPGIFQGNLDKVVPMMLAIATHSQFIDGVRQMAFEFLVSLCEKRTKTCAAFPHFVEKLVHLCMTFMLDIEDEEHWNDDATENVEWSNYDTGFANIDRVARACEAQMLEHLFTTVRQFVGSTWKHKLVAVMCLSQSAEVVVDESQVDEIVGLLVSLVNDAHPRVRYAALHAIGQTSTDQSPYIQETHSELILPLLGRVMEDAVPRVAGHAAAAFVNFAGDLEKETLLPHVPEFMAKLGRLMILPARVAQEQAITAIAVVAGVIGASFVPYYKELAPVLKQIVVTKTRMDERKLRGKAFECLSLMGLSVGRKIFAQDAQEAMQAMMETASRGLEPDDPQRSYIHEAAQRICRSLKDQFCPYLPYLLPGIYSQLQMQPVEVVDHDPEDVEQDMTLDFLSDGKVVGLKTSQIEDFQCAVQLLSCFLEVLGSDFFDHIQDAARSLLPALSFRFSDDVKREAIEAWRELMTAAQAGLEKRRLVGSSLISDLLKVYLQTTLQSMRTEEDFEVLQVQAKGTAKCIKAAGPGTMQLQEVQDLCVGLRTLMEESTQRANSVESTEGLDEDEQAEVEHQRNSEQMLQTKYAEMAGSVMAVHKAHFVAVGLSQILPIIQQCIVPGRSVSDRCLAIYLADDVVDKLGQDSVAVWPVFMEHMLVAITESDAWVRQAAAYGALHSSAIAEFANYASKTAEQLGKCISHPGARKEGNKEATEAAVAALGALCRRHSEHIAGVDQYLLLFLNKLPLVEDLDQAGPTHELLLEFVQSGLPLFQEHLGRVFRIFLDVYKRDTSTETLNAGIRRMVVDVGEEKLRQVQPPLTEGQKRRLLKIAKDSTRM